jgi:hypothetical protein
MVEPRPASVDPAFKALVERSFETVVESYYTRGVEAADRERTRTQAGYTITSAIAAGLVAAGVFTDFETKPDVVKALGLAALFLWVGSAMLFAWAVAAPTADLEKPPGGSYTSASDFMLAVSRQAEMNRNAIRKRARSAFASTILAIALTFIAFSIGVTDRESPALEPARIALTKQGVRALTVVCGARPRILSGHIDRESLGSKVVSIKFDPGICGNSSTEVELPQRALRAVSFR